MFNVHGVTQHVHVPTHISGGVLDLVVTSSGGKSVAIRNVGDIGISYYYLVLFHL